jgi:hypothetical protein
MVDTYFGPPELAAAAAEGPPLEPRVLVASAESLLDELEDGWLRDQVTGLRTFAGVLAGEAISYEDEVEGCFGVRPQRTDEAVLVAAHERLAELLPGGGPLAERCASWERASLVPADRIERMMTAIVREARAWALGLVDLPAGEGVELEIVHDVPWLAYSEYLGDLRGRVSVNVDLPKSAIELLHLAIHETYPGHQAERAAKDHLLVRGRGLVEETLVLVPTPQSVVTEGIAELAPRLVLESEAGPALAAVVRDAGVDFDLAHALAVERAAEPLRWAEVDAALMLHADGVPEADVRAHLERWALMSPQLSAHVIRFLREPASRTYSITYPAGHERCRAYVSGEPERFRRLLTEQVRVRDLVG